jgi:hypothetical protein
MNVDLAQELLNELGSSLENLETQHAALFQFLKDHGIVTDDQIAPYLSQAGKTSSVRWRAARVRLERLFSAEKSREEDAAEKGQHLTSGEQAPSQSQEKETKAKNEEGSGNASAQQKESGTNIAAQTDGTQSHSENNKK